MNLNILVKAILCLYLSMLLHTVCAQPLKPGDAIPDRVWHHPLTVVNHPASKSSVTLNDFKGKPILLDFWATWCGSCITGFPKINALQRKFGNQVTILSVTYEDAAVIQRFFTEKAGKHHTYIQTVINDTILKQHFPHTGVPHIVWIDADGKVINTTLSDELTEKNITAIIENKKPKMATKKDVSRKRPLFLSEDFPEDLPLLHYSIFFNGYYPGLPSGNKIRKNSAGKVYSRQVTNSPIMSLIYPVAYELFQQNGESFSNNRTVLDSLKRPELLDLIPKKGGGYESGNLYSYEIVVPENKTDSLYHYMLADINKYSPYKVWIQKRSAKCLALIRTSDTDKIKSKGGSAQNTFPYQSPSVVINQPVANLLLKLNDQPAFRLPIIDETAYSGNIDITINNPRDIPSLKKELRRYGLDLVEVERELNMLVISDH